MNLRILGRFIRRTNARELGDLALPRLLIQTLGIARLGNLQRDVDKHLDEREGLVGSGGHGVQVAGGGAIGFVGRDERCDCDGGGVGEEFGDLSNHIIVRSLCLGMYCVLKPRFFVITTHAGLRTSAIRLMFSFLSFSVKPRSLFRPKRTLSPSRRYAP
jgi:hypothetical protein